MKFDESLEFLNKIIPFIGINIINRISDYYTFEDTYYHLYIEFQQNK